MAAVSLGSFRLRTGEPQQVLKELIMMPTIYLRLVGIVTSIIVFGCVANQAQPFGSCFVYNRNNDACNFAIAVGVIAFLLCLVFLVKDLLYVLVDFSENLIVKKILLVVDAAANGIWAFMWFVCFCFTADQLRRYSALAPEITVGTPSSVINCGRSGVAFSFFSLLIWVGIVVVNIIFLVLILTGRGGTGGGGGSGSGYASFPEGQSEQPYQGQGGGAEEGGGGGQQYTPPEY